MPIEANDLQLFARIAECASFSKAAERYGLPKSTLSRRLSNLEAQLGGRLMLRSTRKLSLTEFGEHLLRHARQIQEEVEAATALAGHRQSEPSGRLRVSMPGDFASFVLGHMLPDFIRRYPDIVLELDLSPRRVDILGEGYDLALRVGDLPDDANLTARRVCVLDTALYAAPGYAARQGLPDSPPALLKHAGLCLLARSGGPMSWHLQRDGESWEGLPQTRSIVNSPEMLVRLAVAGCGIVAASTAFAEPYVDSGQLVRVLPEWSLPSATVWAVFPGRRLMPTKTRAFLDQLDQVLGLPQPS